MSDAVIRLHQCVASGIFDSGIFDAIHKDGSSTQECEVLDFKQQLPSSDFEYAKTMRDLVALHNSYGGFLVFGVRETEKDRAFELVGVDPNGIRLSKLRDMTRSYVGMDLRLSIASHTVEGLNFEILWIAKRAMGDSPVKFVKNGPEEKPGKPCFKRSEVVFRRLESNAVAQHAEDYDFLYSPRRPPSLELSAEDVTNEEPLDHNLPDRTFVCSRFVGRREDLGDLWSWLADDYSRARLIAGEGGLGKTSLAYRFAEEVASRRVQPFEQVVWLTAKKRQFIPSEDSHREGRHTDFECADSLFTAIASAHGCVESDFEGKDSRELQRLALESCSTVPSFIVVDDVDSLEPEDQQRALELGMRTPTKTKMLLTTRVNFSYSPDNVLKLNGLPQGEFQEYVKVVRDRYELHHLKDSKIDHLREVTGGSPLFTDSLLRLERRGLNLDQAIAQWKGEKGLEARKAALQREVQQLSRSAKRVLYVISLVRNASYVELTQILDYTEQTLGDALQELAGLFLISAPSIAREARYTVEPNTGRLVLELAQTFGIDHAALIAATKSARSDAIGLGLQKRKGIVGLAITQAIALWKGGDPKQALEVLNAASKKLTKPHADLQLAVGRFNLKLNPPNWERASEAFEESYALGQRKQLLFDLWFEAEYCRGGLDSAQEVITKAIDHDVGDICRWFERRAQVHVARAQKTRSSISADFALREIELAMSDLTTAKDRSNNDFQFRQLDHLLTQAIKFREQLLASN